MGLLNFGAKKKAAEDAVLKALFKVELLDLLIRNILEEAKTENSWITNCQGYYDSCTRVVAISADSCTLKWVETQCVRDQKGNEQYVDDVKNELGYSYTASGYVPLHSHRGEDGMEDVPTSRVIYLWTTLVRERLQAKLGDCVFGEVNEGERGSYFRYRVPGLTWKDWF